MDAPYILNYLYILLHHMLVIISTHSDSCDRSYTFDDGGWFTDEIDLLAHPGPCSITVRDSTLTQEEFLSTYAFKEPVIIKGLTHNKKFQDMCRKDAMLNKFGEKIIRLSSANTHSYLKRDVSLQYYVDNVIKPQTLDMLGNETFYWFGDNNHTEWEELFSVYQPPRYKLPQMTGVYSFGLAGAGTGVPFHFHGPGFGEVVFGRKISTLTESGPMLRYAFITRNTWSHLRWFLYPPAQRPHFDPNRTTLHWLLEEYPKLAEKDRPLECTLNQGEIIYFPDLWWHGTLNIDTSVFISTFLGLS